MKSVPFNEVQVGQTFTYNGNEYVKIENKKINCCRFTNAHLVGDENQKIGVKPIENVEVSE